MTGLVFALAGYFAHDLPEVVPFVLLDLLEAIGAERVASPIEYFDECTEYLLVALPPENAEALSYEYQREYKLWSITILILLFSTLI